MKMRNAVVWMSVLAVFACTSSASSVWAAPKSKKSKKAKADTSAEVEPVEPAQLKSTDDLMQDAATKKKPAPKSTASATSEEAEAPADVPEPDAWERPPEEAEKPKKKPVTAAAVAEDLWDGRHFNVGLMAGYGLRMGSGLVKTINPYGLGFGLQGDYEFDSHLVVGIGGEYFLGGSDTPPNNEGVPTSISVSNNYILAHALVGYNWWLTRELYLRPSMWVGAAIALVPSSHTNPSGSIVNALLAPGVTMHYILGVTGWYFGGDLRFNIPLGRSIETVSGFLVLLSFGKRF
jgi:hypothetical protein